MEKLYLFHRENNVKTLGPGIRYTIWVQGCPHNCKGCIVPESHSLNSGGYWITVDEILNEIDKLLGITGITISGGEPFLQTEALISLLKEVRKRELDVICYTGYLYEDILYEKVKNGKEILKYIDILIDGKYEEELNNDNYLRGSENQRIIHLKETYKKHEVKMNELKNRNIEIKVINNKEIFIAGIPSKKMQKDWNKIRKKIYEGD